MGRWLGQGLQFIPGGGASAQWIAGHLGLNLGDLLPKVKACGEDLLTRAIDGSACRHHMFVCGAKVQMDGTRAPGRVLQLESGVPGGYGGITLIFRHRGKYEWASRIGSGCAKRFGTDSQMFDYWAKPQELSQNARWEQVPAAEDHPVWRWNSATTPEQFYFTPSQLLVHAVILNAKDLRAFTQGLAASRAELKGAARMCENLRESKKFYKN